MSRKAGTRLIKKTTGGSTGQTVTILKTQQSWLWEIAATWRGYRWANVEIGDPQARFWGIPMRDGARRVAALTDLVCNRTRLSAFAFDDSDLARYVDKLRSFRPSYFYGYVSMLDAFATFLLDRGIDMQLDLECVITTSEVLTDPIRERLGRAFNTRVFNEYGCGELGTVAHECEHGGLHLSEENMIVEILDGNRPCAPGEPGEMVVTELNNFAMPLIRYRMGDFATLSPVPCQCGRSLHTLQGLHGRAYDMVRSSDGRKFHGEFMVYIFEDLKRRNFGIAQFQVVQTALDRFLIRIVPDGHYSPATVDIITAKIHEEIDANATVEIELTERIERSPSGKMRVVVGLPQETEAAR